MAAENFLLVSGKALMSQLLLILVDKAGFEKTYNTTTAAMRYLRLRGLCFANKANANNTQIHVNGNIRHNKTLDRMKYIGLKLAAEVTNLNARSAAVKKPRSTQGTTRLSHSFRDHNQYIDLSGYIY